MLKFSRVATAAGLGAVILAAGARATPTDFAVAISFDNAAAFNSSGGSAGADLATAAEFTFASPVLNGPNGNTTGNPLTADPVLAAQLAYPTFLSSTNLGLSGTGGTTAFGGTNSFYFFNFVGVNSANGTTAGNIVGSFETATGAVRVVAESANLLDVVLAGVFVPTAAEASLGYVNTTASLNLGFTSNCFKSACSVSGSGTIAASPLASPVPEPPTIILLGASLFVLSLIVRRNAV